MSAYDLDTRRLLAHERIEQLRRDAQASPRRRRRRLLQRIQRELRPRAARRRAASLRTSS